jgi:hypothetical protein
MVTSGLKTKPEEFDTTGKLDADAEQAEGLFLAVGVVA